MSPRGIGAGIALDLGRRGAAVVITYTSKKSLPSATSVSRAIEETGSGGKGILVQADITSATDRQRLIDAAVEASPNKSIDILVHNAGNGDDCYLKDISEEFFQTLVNVNLKGMCVEQTMRRLQSTRLIVGLLDDLVIA